MSKADLALVDETNLQLFPLTKLKSFRNGLLALSWAPLSGLFSELLCVPNSVNSGLVWRCDVSISALHSGVFHDCLETSLFLSISLG